MPAATSGSAERRRRRDRRGRGLRGPLAPSGVPVARSRAEQFDELVLASLGRLERRWSAELDAVEIVVADVPDVPDAGQATGPGGAVPLGHAEPPSGGQPARIVVHRRAVEARASGQRAREALVHEVVVEALADLLGLSPQAVDPEAGADD